MGTRWRPESVSLSLRLMPNPAGWLMAKRISASLKDVSRSRPMLLMKTGRTMSACKLSLINCNPRSSLTRSRLRKPKIAALNLAKFRNAHAQLADAEERADLNEQALAKSKAKARGASVGAL